MKEALMNAFMVLLDVNIIDIINMCNKIDIARKIMSQSYDNNTFGLHGWCNNDKIGLFIKEILGIE